jgi:hypothetical protein
MINKKKLTVLQNLVLDLEDDYQRMSQSGREIYDELSKELGLDPLEPPNHYYSDIGEQ